MVSDPAPEAPTQAPTDPPPGAGRTVRVATYNLFQHSDDARAAAALADLLPLIDVAGLQEFGGPARRRILGELEGFDFYKPKSATTAPPVIWRADRFELVSGSTPMVAKGRKVPKVPRRKPYLPDLYATVVVLRDLALGDADQGDASQVLVANLHTPAHVQRWPGPRRDMYREGLAATAGSMGLTTHPTRAAFLAGDWNWNLTPTSLPVKLLAGYGLEVMWARHPAKVGTHGKRVIDGVFANRSCTWTEVVTRPVVGDHLAALGHFRLVVGDEVPVPEMK